MHRRAGDVTIESLAAETPKFTAPMLMIHGLWCTAAVWRKCMGYFAHLGWSCVALNLRGHASTGADLPLGRVRFADYLRDVRHVIAACEAPPVVLGHDLGGLLALQRDLPAARAVVALAPLVPRPIATTANPALRRPAARLAMLGSRPLPVPHGRFAHYSAREVPGGMRPDSGAVARELSRNDLGASLIGGAVPTLVLAAERDPFAPPRDVQRVAAQVGATFRVVEGASHALPWEPGWEKRVAEIHRWLIRTLGEALLAPHEEEDE